MTILLKKKLLGSGEGKSCLNINYDDLEQRFQIYKYYPKYFHNYDYSTPVIKDLLQDKPIYSKANAHVKNSTKKHNKCGTSKCCLKKEQREQRKELRGGKAEPGMDNKEAKKEASKNYKKERHHVKPSHQELNKHYSEKDHAFKLCKNSITDLNRNVHSNTDSNYTTGPEITKPTVAHLKDHNKAPTFRDPFDSDVSTLVPEESRKSNIIKIRNNSVTSKIKNFMKPDMSRFTEDKDSATSIQLSSSFDQTKSQMTKLRTKSLLQKLRNETPGRRMSELNGMYKKELLT